MAALFFYDSDTGVTQRRTVGSSDVYMDNTDEKTVEIAVAEEPKGRKKRSANAVAQAIAQFAVEKTQTIKGKLDEKAKAAEEKEKYIQEQSRQLSTVKRTVASLEKQYSRLADSKRSELVADYRRVVTQLKQHPQVEKFEVDLKKRIVVTTKMIYVKHKDWPSPRGVGQYQVRIDFSANSVGEGVKLLNITQRKSDYDAPGVINTKPCWGNMANDIRQDFESQDLYELVTDSLAYLESPITEHAYLSKGGDKNKGWEEFLDTAKPMPKRFNFDRWEQTQKGKDIKGAMPTLDELTNSSVAIDASHWGQVQEYVQYSTSNQYWNVTDGSSLSLNTGTSTGPMNVQIRTNQSMNRDDVHIMRSLERIGFTDRAAYYYAGLVNQERRGDVQIIELVLRDRELIEMLVSRDDLRPIRMSEVPTADRVRQVQRFFVNFQDLAGDAQEQLRRRGRLAHRVSSYEELRREAERLREHIATLQPRPINSDGELRYVPHEDSSGVTSEDEQAVRPTLGDLSSRIDETIASQQQGQQNMTATEVMARRLSEGFDRDRSF